MYNFNIEELKKDFKFNLDLYDLDSVSRFCKNLINLKLELNENLIIIIESFTISALLDKSENKMIYIIDLNFIENNQQKLQELEIFMKTKFNIELDY